MSTDTKVLTVADLQKMLDEAARRGAAQVIKHFDETGRIKYAKSPSELKTEQILDLYPELPEGPEKERIATAVHDITAGVKYGDIIRRHYWEGESYAKMTDEFGVSTSMLRKARRAFIKQIARRLFPEAVYEEIVRGE